MTPVADRPVKDVHQEKAVDLTVEADVVIGGKGGAKPAPRPN